MSLIEAFFKMIDLPGAEALGETAGETAGEISSQALSIAGDPTVLAIAIILVVLTIVIVFFLRRIIINSILGIICWLVVRYLFGIEFPFIASLIVSVVFGPAGIGVMLLLKFLGVLP